MLAGKLGNGGISTAFGMIERDTDAFSVANIDVVVRPTAVLLRAESAAGDTAPVVKDIRFLGDGYSVLLKKEQHELRAKVTELGELGVGQSVQVRFAEEGTFFYNAE